MLVAMTDDERTAAARKVLVTGQADQDDTIRAVNEAGLDHYIAKPWDPAHLQATVRAQICAGFRFFRVLGILQLSGVFIIQ